MCEDSASFDLNSTDIAHCISDVDHLLAAKKEEDSFEEGGRSKPSVSLSLFRIGKEI